MNATPQTTAIFDRQFEDKFGSDKDHWEEMTEHARRLERENTKLRKQLKDEEEERKAERYYRDAPQSHE